MLDRKPYSSKLSLKYLNSQKNTYTTEKKTNFVQQIDSTKTVKSDWYVLLK